jgi:hypothetical protein
MLLYDDLNRLTAESPDPHGTGVPHNTEVNRARNRLKSTEGIIAEIEQRHENNENTWQLRQELLRRANSEAERQD